ncbi:hypothetical protein V6N13_018337 [Hibiscus sabdariffa]
MKRKRRERNNNNILLHGSNDFRIGLNRILWRKRHRMFSFASGCLILLFFAVSVFSPPPAANNHFLPLHSLATGENLDHDLWSSSRSKFYYGCSNASEMFQTADVKTHPNRYLLISTSGGLNQQRTGIVDSVVAAYILNATLVIPKLDQRSYWKDTSGFSEIFNVDRFISSLSRDVRIVKELPLAVELRKFDYRLSNRLETDLQKLRCRVNYHALTFTDPILAMGRLLVERMKMKTKHFIALHLRFEPDMLAFTGCDYGGGEKERKELGAIRKRWKTLHSSNPGKMRRQGRCPLTPEEIGLMLRALGFGSDVHIYVASGEVYGGEERLAPLKALFPNYHSKETIATEEELAPFSKFSGRMAALDYIVCDGSDVFVSNNNGNMARMLAGRRRYFGHKPTIRPNAKKLYKLFLARNNMTWDEFATQVQAFQIGFMGAPKEVKPGRGEFHENPRSCICEAKGTETTKKQTPEDYHANENNIREATDEQETTEDDPDWTDAEYLDNNGKELPETEKNASNKQEQPEMEMLFSD